MYKVCEQHQQTNSNISCWKGFFCVTRQNTATTIFIFTFRKQFCDFTQQATFGQLNTFRITGKFKKKTHTHTYMQGDAIATAHQHQYKHSRWSRRTRIVHVGHAHKRANPICTLVCVLRELQSYETAYQTNNQTSTSPQTNLSRQSIVAIIHSPRCAIVIEQ